MADQPSPDLVALERLVTEALPLLRLTPTTRAEAVAKVKLARTLRTLLGQIEDELDDDRARALLASLDVQL